MRRTDSAIATLASLVLIVGCSSQSSRVTQPTSPPTTSAPTTLAPTTLPSPETEQTVVPVSNVVDLGGGATVTFLEPLAAGSNVLVRTSADRELGFGQVATLDPVELTVENDSLGPSGAVLSFPVPDAAWVDGDPSDEVGVSTLDEATGQWTAVPVEFDPATKTMWTTAPHFSWWAPWTWDWTSIGARINQNVGELVGKRGEEPACKRGQPQPEWVSSIAGVSKDSGLVVRACAEGEGDVLAVEFTNNRPYGLVLTYGGPVKWGWHNGGSALDMARNGFVDALMRPDQLYLPPLTRASVGVLRPAAGSNSTWQISITSASWAGDVLRILADELLAHLPIKDFTNMKSIAECATFLAGTDPSFDPVSLFQKAKDSTDCILAVYSKAANGKTIAQLEKARATFTALKNASLIGKLIKFYDYEWTVLDVVTDNVVALDANLGFGFSVYAKATPLPDPVTSPTQPPSTQPPSTQPPTVPTLPTQIGGTLTLTLSENPFTCDGGVRTFGNLSGAAAGERINFSAAGTTVYPGNADGNGNLKLKWQCNPSEAGQTWVLYASGATSGRTGSVTIVGASPPTSTPATTPPTSPVTAPATSWEEVAWGPPGGTVPLFSGGPGVNSNGASGPAARILVGSRITVDCRSYNQAIAASNSGGWWYHIVVGQYAGYWTPASVYENGSGAYPATGGLWDAAVRVC